MSGHMRERSPGTWELRAYAGRDPRTGGKKYRTKTFKGGERDAGKALAKWVTTVDDETVSTTGTVGELLDMWFEVVADSWSPNTKLINRGIINSRLAPLRPQRLDRLKTSTLDSFYATLRAHGGACKHTPPCASRRPHSAACEPNCDHRLCEHGGPLKPSTVKRAHGVLSLALDQAVTWDWIPTNPAVKANPGRDAVFAVESPEAEDVLKLLELALETNMELLVFLVVASLCGARRGEVGALRWKDITEDEITFEFVVAIGEDGPVLVRKGSRQKGGPRTVALDPAASAVLAAHRARCAARALVGGVSLPRDGLVFAATADGFKPWWPNTWTNRFNRLRTAADLPDIRLHDFRHFVVTELRTLRVDDKTIMGRVGHRSAASMERYSHFKKAPDRIAAELLAERLGIAQLDLRRADAG